MSNQEPKADPPVDPERGDAILRKALSMKPQPRIAPKATPKQVTARNPRRKRSSG